MRVCEKYVMNLKVTFVAVSEHVFYSIAMFCQTVGGEGRHSEVYEYYAANMVRWSKNVFQRYQKPTRPVVLKKREIENVLLTMEQCVLYCKKKEVTFDSQKQERYEVVFREMLDFCM